ncbi:MAG: PKD domain-containing protein [Ferruginibacter sp.]|nr:PKD domain-containing protein [Ferruginibacter sp.]
MRYLYTLLIIILFHMAAQSQVANFTYSTTGNTYCDPQRVTFRQTASGQPVSFVWYFGNGTTGNQPVEEVTYLNPGTYTVKLIAVYEDVAVSVEKEITVHSSPTITVRANRNTLCTPDVIQFTATGSSSVVQYQWNFGDGSPVVQSSSSNIQHRYTTPGTYQAKVTGITERGCTESATTNVNIVPLSIQANIDVTSGCIPVTTQLSVTGDFLPGDSVTAVTWNFGDGQLITGTDMQVQHVYNTTQPIDAMVQVVTQSGCSAQFTFSPFAFGSPPPVPLIQTTTGRTTFCGSDEVELSAITQQATHYFWDYGDGSTDSINREVSTHKFRQLGMMPVKVTPYQNGCAGTTDSILIQIEGVIAKFDVRNTCQQLNAFTFPNQSLGNMSTIQWIYGGQATGVQEAVRNGSYTFPRVTTSSVELKISDEVTGCRDSLKRPIYTAQPTLRSNLSSVCKDSSIVYFIENDYPPEANMNYTFNINDRVIRNGSVNTIEYKPLNYGLYNDYVILADQYRGTCNDTLRLQEPVRVKGPIADFEIPSFVCYDSLLAFRNLSYPYYNYEPINQWQWNLGNGEQLTDEHPEPYAYERPGSYNIALTVRDISNCAQRKILPARIVRLPKVDILPRKKTICQGTDVEMIAYSSDRIQWLNLPAGLCNDCDTIRVQPAQSVNYIVQTTNAFGCKNFDSSMLHVMEPLQLSVTPVDTTLCPGEGFQFITQSTGTVTFSPALYLDNPNSTDPYVIPEESIEYTILSTDSLGCFTDSVKSKITLHPKPFLEAGEDLQLDYGSTFLLDPQTDIEPLQYQWTSSNGYVSCPTCSQISGTVDKNTTYTVEITNQKGCKNTDQVKVVVRCSSKKLLLPTAFTPNGDGLNDFFYPISRGFSEIRSFTIFDRSGMKVFERKNMIPNQPNMGWDGRIRGSFPNTSSFVWMAQVECDGQIIVRKGTFTLIQ